MYFLGVSLQITTANYKSCTFEGEICGFRARVEETKGSYDDTTYVQLRKTPSTSTMQPQKLTTDNMDDYEEMDNTVPYFRSLFVD